MHYFSRLTDIVTCNLSELLAKEKEPRAALKAIIAEMEEGLTGAKRSVATATNAEERLRKEIEERRLEVERWTETARKELSAQREAQARLALERKQETLDVMAGLEQQHKAATATREHLSTTLRALEARLAEARRRAQDLAADAAPAGGTGRGAPSSPGRDGQEASRAERIEAELEALRRELGRSADPS